MKWDKEKLRELEAYSPDQMRAFYAARGITLDHPVYSELPTPREFVQAIRSGQADELHKRLNLREQMILAIKEDPFNYGHQHSECTERVKSWSPDWKPFWADSARLLEEKKELLILGGNRSSKSEYAAQHAVRLLAGYNPNKDGGKPPTAWIFSLTEETSKRDLQPLVWKYLPHQWKIKKTSKTICYNARTRFSDNYFVAPNGAECWFKNYRQDPETIEGGQVDLWWGDEEMPVEWAVTLRSRVIDRQGKGLITFTPINGWNATVAEYLVGAQITDWCECDMFPTERVWPGAPKGKIPYIAQPINKDHAVIWFMSRWNTWVDYPSLKSAWMNKDRRQILIRLYGVVQKTGGTKFPKFGKHNIIPREKIPKDGTDYHITDFAFARPWSMIWLRVVRIGDKRRIYVMKDWPDKSTYGEWVVPSGTKKDGAPGPAQDPIGFGTESYADLIRNVEGEYSMKPFIRLGDPRSGKASAVTEEDGGTDLISLMGNEDIYIEPAKGVAENEGINIINQWLDYNDERPIDATNEPSLYICNECEQVIDCLRTWTGGDGARGAAKDFIDLLRYAAVADIDQLEPADFAARGGWTY